MIYDLISAIAAIVGMVGTILAVITTNNNTRRSLENRLTALETNQNNMAAEVKKIGDFAERITRIETRLDNIEKR